MQNSPNFVYLTSTYPEAKIYVNGKDTGLSPGPNGIEFGPISPNSKIQAILDVNGKQFKSEEIKLEKENLKITNEKYSDLISSLKDNPWQKEDLNTKVKLENTRTKKTISEEEIDDLPLEKIKSSLSPESISDFLNVVKTNPTILKRKDDTAYEFTSKDKDEIDLIKKRYNLLDRDIEKITSVLIFDKDNLKLKEIKDILAEGKNRIYMETKF